MFLPIPSAVLYFDHNATHPLLPAAREAWLRATRDFIGNPSSPHRLGSRAETALNEAREKLAGFLGCTPADIVWTSGATEANNAALHHAGHSSDGEAWISAIEHPCVLEAARRFFVGREQLIPATRAGVADLEWLADRLKHKHPAVVGIMAANNETGVLQPWREALELCREHNVPFFCDAAQWIGKLPAAGLGAADYVSGCGHKFGGPQGVGFLKVSAKFRPLLVGGPQEEGRRAGTENVAGVLAMVAALEECEAALQREAAEAATKVRSDFESQLVERLPGAEIVGRDVARLWNTVSAIMPEIPDCRQRWVVKVDKLGFATSTGSACSSGKEQPSHVLDAMGLTKDSASRALRFSSGWETPPADWLRLLDGLGQAYAELSR
ncbi:MAG TPA: cysteine desulfurase family protein [Chthoniobacter sp.]|nr:cysteine desulfurase family protein [Chthoniobacter sp.]